MISLDVHMRTNIRVGKGRRLDVVLMVHVVKGHQHSTSHIDAGASTAEMESGTDSRFRQGQVQWRSQGWA